MSVACKSNNFCRMDAAADLAPEMEVLIARFAANTTGKTKTVKTETIYHYRVACCAASAQRLLQNYYCLQRSDDSLENWIVRGVEIYHKILFYPILQQSLDARLCFENALREEMTAALRNDPRYVAHYDYIVLPNDIDTLVLLTTWLDTIPGIDTRQLIKINPWRYSKCDIPGVTDDIRYYLGSIDPRTAAALDMLDIRYDRYRVLVSICDI